MTLILFRKMLFLSLLCILPGQLSAQFNTATDSVRTMTFEDNATYPAITGYYAPGTLYKIISTNASGAQVVEFKTPADKLILRKEQLDDVPGPAHSGWLCTYNIYNSRGLLTATLMPESVSDATRSAFIGILTPQITYSAYFYRYDTKGRMIMERHPDADSIEYVYDRDDKLVISFDGALKNFYMSRYYQYDSLNRVTTMGIGYAAPHRRIMQEIMDTTNRELPFLPEASRVPQVRTYYDNYNYPGKLDYDVTDIFHTRAGSNVDAETPSTTPDSATTGRITGRSVYVMATQQWLMTTYYYDQKGRVIQTLSDNFPGGKDIFNNLYDTSDRLLSTYQRHTNPQSTLTPQSTILTMFHYDGNGRVDSVKKMFNDDESAMQTIAVNTYDIDGTLINKRLGVSDDTQLESLDYEYTSGRLSGINKTYLTTSGSLTNWFGQEIDSTTGVKWKTRSDGIARAYDYSYDRVGRLLAADYTQQNGMSWTKEAEDYSTSNISYDLDGNFLSLRNRGMNGIVKQTIDSLRYVYDGFPFNSDRLVYITDYVNDAQSVLGDFRELDNRGVFDYTYDRSGNLTMDVNRRLDIAISDFNGYLARFNYNGRAYIDYIYDALGNLLGTGNLDISKGGLADYKMDVYAGGFAYHEGKLEYIEFDGGRIRPVYTTGQPIRYVYDHYVKDDKGSTRVVLSTQKDTSVYAATMETTAGGVEEALFANVNNTRTAKPSGYPVDNTTSPNDFVARLNGSSGQKIGPSLVLRVMAGDSVKLGVKAYYESEDAKTSDNTPEAMVASLLSALNGSVIAEGVHQATGAGSPVNTVFNGTVYSNLTNADPDQNEALQPRAYLNYILFDDQFNMVSENSGVRQVQGDANTLLTLVVAEQQVKKSGFLYVYTSNESNADVYFDNLIVTHTNGPLLEETHYYPSGLTMAGISNQALKGTPYPKNRVKYLGKTFDETYISNTERMGFYHFGPRLFDPQIGRFLSPEPRGISTPYGL